MNCCNSDYRLRFCNFRFNNTIQSIRDIVATVITACGFVTVYKTENREAVISCNSDYRLRFCNTKGSDMKKIAAITVATVITACGFVTRAFSFSC